MFEKMIVSNDDGAGSQGRGRYFLVTSAIVGFLFVSAVVLSIYAVDVNLGNEEFDISMMLAPVPVSEPEPPKPDPQPNQPHADRSELPSRVVNMLRPDEQPLAVPTEVSTTPNKYQARPTGRFELSDADRVGANVIGDPGPTRGGSTAGTSGSFVEPDAVADIKPTEPPPPAITKPKPAGPISLGVINGKALALPKPPYPPAAIALNLQDEVTVQVTIDETGKVVSAKAAKGHPVLRAAAERAAFGARFSPTYLSNVPVKVTGVIVYNFKRS